jgi:hypothetical protein
MPFWPNSIFFQRIVSLKNAQYWEIFKRSCCRTIECGPSAGIDRLIALDFLWLINELSAFPTPVDSLVF